MRARLTSKKWPVFAGMLALSLSVTLRAQAEGETSSVNFTYGEAAAVNKISGLSFLGASVVFAVGSGNNRSSIDPVTSHMARALDGDEIRALIAKIDVEKPRLLESRAYEIKLKFDKSVARQNTFRIDLKNSARDQSPQLATRLAELKPADVRSLSIEATAKGISWSKIPQRFLSLIAYIAGSARLGHAAIDQINHDDSEIVCANDNLDNSVHCNSEFTVKDLFTDTQNAARLKHQIVANEARKAE